MLDIGGWGRPFTRADWVLDLMPYETRGDYGRDGPEEERFSPETWIQRDICDREPLAVRGQPVRLRGLLAHARGRPRPGLGLRRDRPGRASAGYIEVPSRLEEQSYGFQGPWVGWGHHRWLVDVDDGRIEFVFKHHILHGRESDHFPGRLPAGAPAGAARADAVVEGGFEYGERIFIGPERARPLLADFVARHRGDVEVQRASLKRRIGDPAARRLSAKIGAMDLDVLFVGTAGSAPTARRGLPATLVRRGGDRLLFDCGEGTQRQLVRSVGLIELEEVFITHFHADHVLGLPGMLKTFSLRGRERPLTVYGPRGPAAACSPGWRR